MKTFFLHIAKKFTGGLASSLGLVIGLSIFFSIAYAAVTISTTSVTPGTPMTASLWNAVKTDLDNLAAEFNDIGNFNNVTLTSVATDDVLAYDGSNWINQASAAGGGGTGGAPGTLDWSDCNMKQQGYVTDYTTLTCDTGYVIVDSSCAASGSGVNSFCQLINPDRFLYRGGFGSIKCCKLN